jgi:adenylate kinase family enzyme
VERISVVGTSATGKTTFAKRLAAALSVRHVELDDLHFESGWREVPNDEFLARIATAISGPGGWVVDGNYSIARPLVWSAAGGPVRHRRSPAPSSRT